MLVITRKPDQAFKIGEDIWVEVISVNGNQVRLGIDAPREIAIERDDMIKGNPNEDR